MHTFCLFLLLACAGSLYGQSEPNNFTRRGMESDVLVELRGGLTLGPGRRALNPRESGAGLSLRPGGTAGLSLVLPPTTKVAAVFGVDYLRDRGAFTDYTQSSSRIDFLEEGATPDRIRRGRLTYQEDFVRIRLEARFHASDFYFTFGFQWAEPVRARYTFDFTQTTRRLQDRRRGVDVELPTPIVSANRAQLTETPSNPTAGINVGLGYRLNDRWDVYARVDRNLHLYADRESPFQFRWVRLDFGVGYRLAYL